MVAEPTVPEEVYRDAAKALYSTTGNWDWVKDLAVEDTAAGSAGFRAAVEVAYRAGYADGHAEWCPGCNECGPQEATDG